jgi:hypothetical protein
MEFRRLPNPSPIAFRDLPVKALFIEAIDKDTQNPPLYIKSYISEEFNCFDINYCEPDKQPEGVLVYPIKAYIQEIE